MNNRICNICNDEDKIILEILKKDNGLRLFILSQNRNQGKQQQQDQIKNRIPLDDVLRKIQLEIKYKEQQKKDKTKK